MLLKKASIHDQWIRVDNWSTLFEYQFQKLKDSSVE